MAAPTQQPLTLNDAQKSTLSATPYDAAGSIVPLPAGSTVTYVSDTPSIITVTANSDGVTALAAGVSAGSANITASLTLPGATTPLVQNLPVTVVGSAIVGFTISATTPQ